MLLQECLAEEVTLSKANLPLLLSHNIANNILRLEEQSPVDRVHGKLSSSCSVPRAKVTYHCARASMKLFVSASEITVSISMKVILHNSHYELITESGYKHNSLSLFQVLHCSCNVVVCAVISPVCLYLAHVWYQVWETGGM